MHGCQAKHLQTSHVVESIAGQEVWSGQIEVFELTGHPKANKAFAWGYEDEKGEIQYIAVLNVPPITSPREAVQAAIASGRFN